MAIGTTHAGHGGIDPGALGFNKTEHGLMMELNDYIVSKTGAYNASDETAISVPDNLAKLVRNMNSKKIGTNDFHISNHLNAFNGSANGTEVFYYEGSNLGKEVATKVSAAIANALGTIDRGPKTAPLYVIANSNGNAILIEWAFIDNKGDFDKFTDNWKKAVDAILPIFGYATTEPITPTTPEKPQNKPKFKVGDKVVLIAGAKNWNSYRGEPITPKFSVEDMVIPFEIKSVSAGNLTYKIARQDYQEINGWVDERHIAIAPTNDIKPMDKVTLRRQATNWVGGDKINETDKIENGKSRVFAVKERKENRLLIYINGWERWAFDWDCVPFK